MKQVGSFSSTCPARSTQILQLSVGSRRSDAGTEGAGLRGMREWIDELENRTKQFAIEVIKLCAGLEDVRGMRQLSWQLADSAGSVASNHRAMRRGRSDREFAAKLQTVNEEIDESVMWLEIADAVLTTPNSQVRQLLQEGVELRSIFATARKTTRERQNRSPSRRRTRRGKGRHLPAPMPTCSRGGRLSVALPQCPIAPMPHCRDHLPPLTSRNAPVV
jgi:four helix bundle protein